MFTGTIRYFQPILNVYTSHGDAAASLIGSCLIATEIVIAFLNMRQSHLRKSERSFSAFKTLLSDERLSFLFEYIMRTEINCPAKFICLSNFISSNFVQCNQQGEKNQQKLQTRKRNTEKNFYFKRDIGSKYVFI